MGDHWFWSRLPESAPAFVSLVLVALCFLLFALTRLTPDVILIGAAVALMALGILTPAEALGGLANEGVVAVGVLFIVAAAVHDTGAIDWVARYLLGRPRTLRRALPRMILPVMGLSALLNNTPLVAMMIPAISDYCRKSGLAASKLMIPLSYAALLGGLLTLIGTSTNLVVQGMLIQATGRGLGMFDITWVGLPVALVGGLYLLLVAPWLLPDRRAAVSTVSDPREYTVDLQVEAGCPLVRKTIEAAGLRHLPGLFLAEIHREGVKIAAVSPQETLAEGDRLLFVGAIESVRDLYRIRGLVPATDDVRQLAAPCPQRQLVEAVVSNTCPLVGQTLRESRFRSHYDAVVVAVARNGQRLRQKLGDIELHAGDVLLIEAHESFADRYRDSRDFFLVSPVTDSTPPRHDRALVAVGLLLAMVVVVASGLLSMTLAALLTAAGLLATRCITLDRARRSVSWDVVLSIAAAFALGVAMHKTGAASVIAYQITTLAADQPWLSLVVIYLATMVTTELVTNNAAAALLFPFALQTAQTLHVSHVPFVIAVMIAASSSFATPMGYQTNLMVYGPGGYRFLDYVRVGLPLDLLVAATALAVIPLAFPF